MPSFWSVLEKGEVQIKDLPLRRWLDHDGFLTSDPSVPDKSVSRLAAFVSDEIVEALPAMPQLATHVCRQDRMSYEAARQALSAFSTDELKGRRVDQVFGAMNRPEETDWISLPAQAETILRLFGESPRKERILEILHRGMEKILGKVDYDIPQAANSVTGHQILRQIFGTVGEDILIDAACASSLAAVDVAVKKLLGGECDLVLCGGVESDLAPPMYCTFTRVGVLGTEPSKPFDRNSLGLSQGEGVVLFAMERAETAIAAGRKIHAVLRSWASSSDGRSGSLFSPTVDGQLQMYKDAYRGLETSRVCYLEAHATGTAVGDQTEFDSLTRFFAPNEIPVGSVKGLLGHTRGAAGAVSLLKSILILQKNRVPPSPYFQELVYQKSSSLFVNRDPIELSSKEAPRLIGCSALGFGGTNYHVVVEESLNPTLKEATEKKPDEKLKGMVLLASAVCNAGVLESEEDWIRQKFFQQTIPQIDTLQIQAAVAAKKVFDQLSLGLFDRRKISVLSASFVPLKLRRDLSIRVSLPLLLEEDGWTGPEKEALLRMKEHFCPTATEDMGAGLLNNVVAGRICNLFDITGKSYNIDENAANFPAVLACAQRELEHGAEAVVLIACDEKKGGHFDFHHETSLCLFLTTEEICRRKSLKASDFIQAPGFDPLGKGEAVWDVEPSVFLKNRRLSVPVIDGGVWSVEMSTLQDADWSRRAFLFTGQGPEIEGTFADYFQRFPGFRAVFDRADALAKAKGLPAVSDILLQPQNVSIKDKPRIRNLALLSLQVAIAELLIARGLRPEVLTGHSFGEYAAWVVAGSVSFEDMFEIVFQRDNVFSSPPNEKGYLLAIQAEPGALQKEIDEGWIHVSNRNTPQQCVISFAAADLQKAQDHLRSRRIAHRLLGTVPQPYHSPLMAATREGMHKFLHGRAFEFKPPVLPVLSSVGGHLIDAGNFKDFDLRDLLADQVLKPVNFVQQIRSLADRGLQSYLEIGPGSMLSSFTTRILEGRRHQLLKIDDFLSGQEKFRKKFVGELKQSRFFASVAEVIARVTGYEIEKILIEDRFQDDLGIDSLKKAEIVFEVVETQQIQLGSDIDLSRMEAIGDVVQFLEEQAKGQSAVIETSLKEPAFDFYESTRQEQPLWRLSQPTVRENHVLRVSDFSRQSPAEIIRGLKDFLETQSWAETRIDVIVDAEIPEKSVIDIFVVIRDLVEEYQDRPIKLILGVDARHARFLRPFTALLKSLQKEDRFLWHKSIEFDEFPASQELAALFGDEASDPFAADVVYKNSRRFIRVPRLRKSPSGSRPAPKKILFCGGLGGLGEALIRTWPDPDAVEMTILGRRAASETQVAAKLAELKPLFAKLEYITCDLSQPGSLESLDARFETAPPELVVNAAGLEKSYSFLVRTRSDFKEELNGKLEVARRVEKWALSRGVRALHFTSIVSRYGNTGQAVYSYSNAAIEEEVREWIAWPPWKGVGMAQAPTIMKSLASRGIPMMDPTRGCELFHAVVGGEPLKLECQSDLDHCLYSQALHEQQDVVALAGQGVSLRGLRYERVFDPATDLFLNDHQVQGQMIVPAAALLSMLFAQTRLLSGAYGPVTSFRMLSFVPVPTQGRKISVLLDEIDEEGGKVTLHAQIPVAKASFSRSWPSSLSNWITPAGKVRAKWEAGRIYRPDRLFHGPLLRDLKGVEFFEGKLARAVVDLSVLPRVSRVPWMDRFIHLVDSAFQIFGLSATYETGQGGLPSETGRVWVEPDLLCLGEVEIWTRIDHVEEQDCEGVIQAVDREGRLILDMQGVKTRRLR